MEKLYTFSLHTLGCKVNSYESNIIIDKCSEFGFRYVKFGEPSDIVIINTCAVTEESARKSRQFARRAKRTNPDCILVVVGCYSQICDDSSLDFADIVLGTKRKSDIVFYIREFIEKRERIIDISDMTFERQFEKMQSDYSENIRATVKIQDGCNNFCSYCIIPYARGRIRSKDINDGYNEVLSLVKRGYKEIVLTGIHITSYGLDGKNYDLCDFLEKIDDIDGLERIRLGSLEPSFITEKNVERLKKIKHLCHHFHLSLQSGCSETLKRMNRKYTADEYYKSSELLKNNFLDVSLTTDVIVGFCGETDEEFFETCSFVKNIGFSKIHIFPFSPRKGTAAYKMKGVPDVIKTDRMKTMGKIEKDLEYLFRSDMIGKIFTVLTEKNTGNYTEGYTSNYIKVKINKICECNVLTDVFITGVDGEYCIGEIV